MCLLRLLPEYPVRPEEQKQNEYHKRNRVLPLGWELPHAKVLCKADEQATEGSSRQTPDAADDDSNDSHDKRIEPHGRSHVCVKGDHDCSDGGEERADGKCIHDVPIRVYPAQSRKLRVVCQSPQGLAKLRPRENQRH